MEDFRVEVQLADDGETRSLQEGLRGASAVAGAPGGAVMVTRDGRWLFLYAESEEQARGAERLVRAVDSADIREIAVTRWHPIEEAWKDVSIPLPTTPVEEAAELAAREAAEAAEAAEEGAFDWHVVAHLPRRAEAVELARALAGEGLAVHRRWRYVVVGVLTEERAAELAARLEDELPEDADVRIEANLSDLARSPLQFLPF